MTDTPAPEPRTLTVPSENLIQSYSDELARMTHRALKAEAAVAVLSGQLDSALAAHDVLDADVSDPENPEG